jgi:hypothetical protein
VSVSHTQYFQHLRAAASTTVLTNSSLRCALSCWQDFIQQDESRTQIYANLIKSAYSDRQSSRRALSIVAGTSMLRIELKMKSLIGMHVSDAGAQIGLVEAMLTESVSVTTYDLTAKA